MPESLGRILAPLDAPSTPDDEFLERLFERVAPLALAASQRDQTLLGRSLRVLRRGVPQLALTQRQRTALLLLAMLAMLVVVLTVAIVASRPDPLGLITASEMVYRDPPAFTMEVAYSDGNRRRWSYDGDGRLRVDILRGSYIDRPTGSWILTDIDRSRRADLIDATGTVSVIDLRPGLSPLHQLDLRWGSDFSEWSGRVNTVCRDWTYVGHEVIAGRRTDELQCIGSTHGPDGAFWVDQESKLVLKSTAVAEVLPDRYVTGEVVAFQLDAKPDPEQFAFADGDPAWGAVLSGGDEVLVKGTRYVTNRFTPAFAITVPDVGWRSWGTDPDIVGFTRGGDTVPEGWGQAFALRLSTVTQHPSDVDVTLGQRPQDVIDWIRDDPLNDAGPAEAATIGSYHGLAVEFRDRLPDDFDQRCPVPADGADPPACRRWFKAGRGWWTHGWPKDTSFRLVALDVNGQTITLLTYRWGSSSDAQSEAADRLLRTIEFLH